jgi:hypothetical protein
VIVDTHSERHERPSADLSALHPVIELAENGWRRRGVASAITFVILFACFLELRTHTAWLRKLESDWRSSPAALRKYPHKADKAEMQSVFPSETELHIETSAPTPRTAMPKSSAGVVANSDEADKSPDADASWNLGLSYLKGDGVPQDKRRAAELLKKAANLGNPRAQAALSDLYLRGIGVQRDYVRAYTWASIAAGQLGGEDERLAALAQRMTKAQLEDAKGRVQTWFAQKSAILRH